LTEGPSILVKSMSVSELSSSFSKSSTPNFRISVS
jgi:hypothetical protein